MRWFVLQRYVLPSPKHRNTKIHREGRFLSWLQHLQRNGSNKGEQLSLVFPPRRTKIEQNPFLERVSSWLSCWQILRRFSRYFVAWALRPLRLVHSAFLGDGGKPTWSYTSQTSRPPQKVRNESTAHRVSLWGGYRGRPGLIRTQAQCQKTLCTSLGVQEFWRGSPPKKERGVRFP